MTIEVTDESHSWVDDEYFDSERKGLDYYDEGYEADECDDDDEATEHVAKKNFGFRNGVAEAVEMLNELLDMHMPSDAQEWKISQTSWKFDFVDLNVELSNSNGISVSAQSDVMPRRYLDPLRHALRQILSDSLGEPIWKTLAFGTMLLRLAEEASWYLRSYLEHYFHREDGQQQAGWDAAAVNDWSKVVDNPYGVDLTTVKDTAIHLLGKPITEILNDIPSSLRVLHVEPVFRHDLVKRFLDKQESMRADLETCSAAELRRHIPQSEFSKGRVISTVEGMAEFVSKPTVTFHGAPRAVVSSIVRNGFVVPGQTIASTGEKHTIRCGASFGVGIYSSPDLSYASVYGQGEDPRVLHPGDIPGFRIVVCATLMGRPAKVTRDQTLRRSGVYHEGCHSHISPNQLEYIVFKSSQIIPCYVLHVDFGSTEARKHLDLLQKQPTRFLRQKKAKAEPALVGFSEWPAAKKAKVQALKAGALKWFPYGYGPATGTKFVVEDVADVSDDEEDYGEFQAIRGEHTNEVERAQKANANTSWFDEYQTARKN
ncbi:hypothetical protein PRZ48_008359 [Zasmidium cellare]|uniref:PARP catalytic domain-containing protein n=1 Tax=Zasmidium cellare TaxID=395010 RepID=A0ABR0EGD2_ZASCE|nr:hypothetical protein PRZ48_008359 [Zasmidium cellare]